MGVGGGFSRIVSQQQLTLTAVAADLWCSYGLGGAGLQRFK
jgi:hypothetical protein